MAKKILLLQALIGIGTLAIACSDGGDGGDGGVVVDSSVVADGAAVADGSTSVDGSVAPDSSGGTDYRPAGGIVGTDIIFVEVGGPTNTWHFTDGTTATLQGVGDFPYTYTTEATLNKTTIVFNVGGQDTYDMTWTSAAGGTCTESFDGAPGNDCTFTVQ